MIACNALVSLDRCTSDADCPTGAACDPDGRFCIKYVFDAAPSDAPVDTNVADAGADGSDASDAGLDVDATPPPCNRSARFGTPALVRGTESLQIYSARFAPDEKTMLFSAQNGGPEEFRADLFYASRSDLTSAFAVSGPIPVVNCDQASDYWPTISADGKLLFFESSRALAPVDGGCGREHARVWSATRVNTVADFDPPKLQSTFAIDGSIGEGAPYLHPGGRSLYFSSFDRGGHGGADIFVAQLNELGLVTAIENVDAINTATGENEPVVTLDDTVLYFSRETPVTILRHIFVSTRPTPAGTFGPATEVTELQGPFEDFPSWISDDQCRIYFISTRPAAGDDAGDAGPAPYRLWVAERP